MLFCASRTKDRRSPRPSWSRIRRSRWSSARCCSYPCTSGPLLRCDSSRVAVIRRLPKYSINRSARLSPTFIGRCAFCDASSARRSDVLRRKEFPYMRCRDVEALWDDLRGECQASLKQTVHTHLRACPSCQAMYEQYEGVAYCLSSLPQPEPSCDLAKKVIQHVAALKGKYQAPIVLAAVMTPLGRLHVGLKHNRIAYLSLDAGEASEDAVAR